MTLTYPGIPDIYAGGWRLRPGMALPGALAWRMDGGPMDRGPLDRGPGDDGEPDVVFGSAVAPEVVPETLDDPVVDLGMLQIAADGTALVRFEDIGRILLRDRLAVCKLEVSLEAPELTAVIFGNVLACICWRRGQLSLHGSTVAIAGRAVLLLGRAATGKSLLAAALVRRRHIALSDEVAIAAAGMCFPAGSMLSLADDALMSFGIDPEGLPQYCNFPIAKRLWIDGERPEPRPYPIAAVVCLSKAPPDAPNRPEPLFAETAVAAIINQVYRRDMLRVLDTEAIALREARALVSTVPVYQFPVARDLTRIDEAAMRIIALVARN